MTFNFEHHTADRVTLAAQAASGHRRAYIAAHAAGLTGRAAYHYALAGQYELEASRLMRRSRSMSYRPASGSRLRVA